MMIKYLVAIILYPVILFSQVQNYNIVDPVKEKLDKFAAFGTFTSITINGETTTAIDTITLLKQVVPQNGVTVFAFTDRLNFNDFHITPLDTDFVENSITEVFQLIRIGGVYEKEIWRYIRNSNENYRAQIFDEQAGRFISLPARNHIGDIRDVFRGGIKPSSKERLKDKAKKQKEKDKNKNK